MSRFWISAVVGTVVGSALALTLPIDGWSNKVTASVITWVVAVPTPVPIPPEVPPSPDADPQTAANYAVLQRYQRILILLENDRAQLTYQRNVMRLSQQTSSIMQTCIHVLAGCLATLSCLALLRPRPRPGWCPYCNYNLTGNTSGVCPECGKEIRGPSPQGSDTPAIDASPGDGPRALAGSRTAACEQ